jgi:chaperonin GroES
MPVRPLHDRILVKRAEESEQKSSSGIIIPDTAKEKPQKGTVVAVGEGKKDEQGKRIAVDVKEGDEVLFGKYAGTEVKIEGEEYLIMHESDILGVLTAGGQQAKAAAAAQ